MTRSNARARVAAHRAKMRAQGMKLIQIWVPDPGAPGFAAEAQRQSRAVAQAPDHDEIMDWMERTATAEEEDFVPAEIATPDLDAKG